MMWSTEWETLGWKSGAGTEEEGDGAKERLGVLEQGAALGGRTLSNSLTHCDPHLQQL